MVEYRLPDALVEKMAEALHGMMCASPTPYEQCRLTNGNYFCGAAKTAAAALLDGCEVEERYELVGPPRDPPASRPPWRELLGDDQAFALRALASEPGATLVHRLLISTPAEPFDLPDLPVVSFPRLDTGPEETPP